MMNLIDKIISKISLNQHCLNNKGFPKKLSELFLAKPNTKVWCKKVSKLGRKSYLTKSCLNLPKLGKNFDKVSGKNVAKFEQFLTTFY